MLTILVLFRYNYLPIWQEVQNIGADFNKLYLYLYCVLHRRVLSMVYLQDASKAWNSQKVLIRFV